MKALPRLVLATLLLASGFSSAAEAGPALPIPGIEANNALWQEAMNRSLDDAGIRSLYTDNAVVVPPSQAILDEADFGRFLNEYLRTRMVDFQIQPISLHAEGDRAWQSAVWMATLIDREPAIEIDGELINVFRRQADGSWKIEFQSWN